MFFFRLRLVLLELLELLFLELELLLLRRFLLLVRRCLLLRMELRVLDLLGFLLDMDLDLNMTTRLGIVLASVLGLACDVCDSSAGGGSSIGVVL